MNKIKTAVLVSIHSGILLCAFQEMHETIERFFGGPVWTHQLPATCDYLRPKLEDQYKLLESQEYKNMIYKFRLKSDKEKTLDWETLVNELNGAFGAEMEMKNV